MHEVSNRVTYNECPLGAGWEIEFLLPGLPMLGFFVGLKIKTKVHPLTSRPNKS